MKLPSVLRSVRYRKLLTRIRQLEQFRQQSPEEIRTYQWTRVQEIVDYAYRYVPFYRQLYHQVGYLPGDLKSWDDFRNLPTIHREMFMATPEADLLTELFHEQEYATEDATSGTTGKPFLFYKDKRLVEREFLLYNYQKLLLGWVPGERELFVKGRIEQEGKEDHLIFREDNQTFRLNGFRISREVIRQLAGFIRRQKIQLIYGYPTPIRQLCHFAREEGVEIRVKLIITMGEVLTDSMRQQMEDCFGASVYQLYGAAEAMHMAHECPRRNGLHVDAERYLLEIRRRRQPYTGSGSLLITDMMNRVMPLIRYEIGDHVQFADQPCDCGDRTPLIRSISGKRAEIFRTPSGKELNLHILLDDIFADLNQELASFRLIVQNKRQMELLLVPAQKNDSSLWKQAVARLQEYLGEDVHIQFKLVDRLEPTPAGKNRSIVVRSASTKKSNKRSKTKRRK